MKVLSTEFYLQQDTLELAKLLLGKMLVTEIDGIKTSGRIVETEAYLGVTDAASHAFGGRRTQRTETMYKPGGHAYVYLCYGIHHLFNVVTNLHDVPHAILIRAIEPLEGINTMLQRRNKIKLDFTLTRGPGSLAAALGIKTIHSGLPLSSHALHIADDNFIYKPELVIATPRIGVEYAGIDALLPYRFLIKENKWVSKPPK